MAQEQTRAELASQVPGQLTPSQNLNLDQYIQSPTGQLSPLQPGSLPAQDENAVYPFGFNLFNSGIESSRESGINPNYLVTTGDKISVQMWGAVNFAQVLTVDTQGNIFIPNVGPVEVGDIPAASLNQIVTNQVRRVYTKNVNIYINLLTATPVGLFVTGAVSKPGQYAGLSSDSVLHYLKRAGGIDPLRGSYRKIQVLRNDTLVKSYDLYEFLKLGKLSPFSFQDNDVLLVAEQGSVVNVEGTAKNPFSFELSADESSGIQLMNYALPFVEASHVAVSGIRDGNPVSVYLSISEFESFKIEDGDSVLFNNDIRPQVLSVSVSGSYLGPSFYAVTPDARLQDVLSLIEVNPEHAAIDSIYIKRKSVAEQQAELLSDSLYRLERSVLTAPASSEGEAAIRIQEAQLITQFIERAKEVEPLGKVVVTNNGVAANIRLEDGDEIVIPEKTDLIQISGEVLIPQAIVYREDAVLSDYISAVGGFTERANKSRVAIIHANGLVAFSETSNGSYWLGQGSSLELQPGDQVLVLPKVDNKILQAVKDITQIIFQIAVAANVATD
ncbi:polysaccharide biosynthesis/export family protein [Alteromonas sp. 5E99-2]|uniref:polysaccharide biosynthesis/export family protein n=1 Tax=Alteromonas sp. 5E99-2 TaxID=2817683 RepID=UPI001F621BC6|nr:polysaccharide biosynthesis/export family protein [Alteromonas sp. 5E99-2]